MNTIFAAGLNNQERAEGTSINIKNNKVDGSKPSGISFQGVFLSGMDVDAKKLDRNTYESLLKETDDVKQQIMQSATNAKANLKALFNRLSGAEAVRIDEDGFNLNDMSPEEAVSILDKIKIELATYCDDYQLTGSSVGLDKIKAVVGNAGLAQSIANKMDAAGVPATEDNVNALADALSSFEGKESLSEAAKNYLVANNMEPSIENIHIAEAKAGSLAGNGSGNGNVNQPQQGEAVSATQWQQLKPQVYKLLNEAGIEPQEKDYNNAKTFISMGIPVTTDTLSYKNELDNLLFDKEQLANNIIKNMAAGGDAKNALVIGQKDIVKDVADALNVLENVEYEHVEYAENKQAKAGKPLTLRSIEEAIDALGKNVKTATSDGTVTLVSNNTSAHASYKMVLEVQILLTAKSGMFLERQGISVMASSIAMLHKQLTALDKEAMMEQIADSLTEDINSPVVASAYELVNETRQALNDIKQMPDVTIGSFVGDVQVASVVSIGAFAEEGRNFKGRFRQASQTYQAVGTSRRADMGDSVDKAVKASTQSLLKDLGLENNQANADAIRILGYNEMEITKDSVAQVKELYATLNSLIEHMTPEACIKMIRDGINPMNEDIHVIDKYLKSAKGHSRADTKNDDASKFSTFLYKMDKTGGISSEERKQFIGIYKMMNMFLKDAGVAIGALCKQNADITMGNLCMAYNSRKNSGMDVSINDESDVKIATTEAYYLNLFESSASKVTPLTLKNVQEEKPINERSVEEFCEALADKYDASEEAKYYDEYLEMIRNISQADKAVLHDIEMAGQTVTVNNIETFKMLMESSGVSKLFGKNGRRVENFSEKLDSKEALEAEYEDMKKDSDEALSELMENDDIDIDYNMLRNSILENKQISVIAALAKKHDYNVPVLTGEGVSMMKLTLISDSDDKGRISISFESPEWGKTSVEIRVSENAVGLHGVCAKEETALQTRLVEIAQSVKNEYAFEQATVYCTRSDMVNRITYEDAKDKVATERLYRMSKSIISKLV